MPGSCPRQYLIFNPIRFSLLLLRGIRRLRVQLASSKSKRGFPCACRSMRTPRLVAFKILQDIPEASGLMIDWLKKM